jgi:excisionase family DNA binding protein
MADDVWLPIHEAARRLGCSPATVRRRIKAGELEAELQPGKHGVEYKVRLPAVATHESIHAYIPEQGAGYAWAQLLEDYKAASQAVGEWRARSERQEERADQYEQRLAEAKAEVDRLRAELERARRPWWRLWG